MTEINLIKRFKWNGSVRRWRQQKALQSELNLCDNLKSSRWVFNSLFRPEKKRRKNNSKDISLCCRFSYVETTEKKKYNKLITRTTVSLPEHAIYFPSINLFNSTNKWRHNWHVNFRSDAILNSRRECRSNEDTTTSTALRFISSLFSFSRRSLRKHVVRL